MLFFKARFLDDYPYRPVFNYHLNSSSMDSKKISNANLERYRFTFLLVGLTISLGLVILIFQWRFFEPNLTKHLKAQRETIEKELPSVYVLREVPVQKERFTQPLMRGIHNGM